MINKIKSIKILTPNQLGNDWIEVDNVVSQSFKDIMSNKIIDIDECSTFCVTPTKGNSPHLQAIKIMDSMRKLLETKIKINEIMVGNMFHNLIVESITKSGVRCFSKNKRGFSEIKVENLTPIFITEDLLLNFGFVKTKRIRKPKTEFYEIGRITLKKCSDFYYTLNDGYGTAVDVSKSFSFVHQLQNLFFCLTGQELSVVANGS